MCSMFRQIGFVCFLAIRINVTITIVMIVVSSLANVMTRLAA